MPPGPLPEASDRPWNLCQPRDPLHMKEDFDEVKTDSSSTTISTYAQNHPSHNSIYDSQQPFSDEDSDETCFSSRWGLNRSGSTSRQQDGEFAVETQEDICPLQKLDAGTQDDVDREMPKSAPGAHEDRN